MVRRGEIAREVALVASLSTRDDIVQPLGAWGSAPRGAPGVALPFEDPRLADGPRRRRQGRLVRSGPRGARRVPHHDNFPGRGGGRGPLPFQNRAARRRVADSVCGGQKPRGPVLQLTGFELASPLIVPQQKSGRPMTTPLPTALVRGYVPAYRQRSGKSGGPARAGRVEEAT